MPAVSGSFPIFVTLPARQPLGSSIGLVTFSAGSNPSGAYGDIGLFVDGAGFLDQRTLFIQGENSGKLTSVTYLSIRGDYIRVTSTIPLVVSGPSGHGRSVPLSIQGLGSTNGAKPFNSFLYMACWQWTIGQMPMVIQGPGYPAQSEVSLWTAGTLPADNSIPICISGVGAVLESTNLMIGGW